MQPPKTDLIICPPVVLIDALDCGKYNKDETNCNVSSYENKLTWTYPDKSGSGADCDKDIVKYTIYYSPAVGADFTKNWRNNLAKATRYYVYAYQGRLVHWLLLRNGNQSLRNGKCKEQCGL